MGSVDIRRWLQRMVAAVGAVAVGSATLLGVADSVQAASGDQLFWVGSKASPSINNGLFGSTAGTVSSATNLAGQSGLYRSLATDGTSLYFSDGTNLVRTAMNGTGKTTLVSGVTAPEQIMPAGAFLYYTLYNGGVYGISLSGSFPATANLIFTVAGGGWNGVAVSGTTIYATNRTGSGTQGNQGLYSANLNGTSPATATMIDAAAVMVEGATMIYAAAGRLYAAGSSGAIKVRESTGTWSSISVASATSQSVYSVYVLASTIYFSASGAIGSVGTNGAAPTILSSGSQFTSAWSVAAVEPATYTVTYDANGGIGSVPIDHGSPYASGSTVTVLGNSGNLTRTDYQFKGWRLNDLTTGTFVVPGNTFTITTNTVLYAQWNGGPLAFSATSGGPAITTLAFPTGVVGQPSTMTVYIKNIGESVLMNGPSSIGVSGSGVTKDSTTTCPVGSLAKNAECTQVVTWTPSSTTALSGTLNVGYGMPTAAQLTLTGSVAQTPTARTDPASSVTASTATLNGVVNARGSSTSALTIKYSSVQADITAGNGTSALISPTSASGFSSIAVSASVAGLSPLTTYYYRVSATNIAGTANGLIESFTTLSSGGGGGGGGGSGSLQSDVVTPTPVPSPTPSTTTTPTNPDPLGPQDLPTVTKLTPGGTEVTTGGERTTVKTVPNKKKDTVTSSGDDWKVTTGGRTPAGTTTLGPKNSVQIPQGGTAVVSGSGYQPGTKVQVYAMNPALLLGTLTVGANGTFRGNVTWPAGLPAGASVLQMNGYSVNDVVRSYSLGINVTKVPAARVKTVTSTIYFAAGSSKLSPEALRKLAKIALSVPKGAKATTIVSAGYVQPTSDTSNDFTLSTARATKVADQLKANKLKGKYLITGRGVAKEKDARGRKVVVTITYTVR